MEPSFGICFDIDGVLMKSDKAIPEAKLAMKMLRGYGSKPHHREKKKLIYKETCAKWTIY
jgi:FMN phosphatase YigB (HAD superfamily)